MVVSPKTLKNIKHAIRLALKGDTLGAQLCEDYCVAGNNATKSYVCIPLITHPEYAQYMPCCVKNFELAVDKARKLGVPESVIKRAREMIKLQNTDLFELINEDTEDEEMDDEDY
jgi:hypothetical protein